VGKVLLLFNQNEQPVNQYLVQGNLLLKIVDNWWTGHIDREHTYHTLKSKRSWVGETESVIRKCPIIADYAVAALKHMLRLYQERSAWFKNIRSVGIDGREVQHQHSLCLLLLQGHHELLRHHCQSAKSQGPPATARCYRTGCVSAGHRDALLHLLHHLSGPLWSSLHQWRCGRKGKVDYQLWSFYY